jgi:ABC-type ATPase with predicted acetyltransferase domain
MTDCAEFSAELNRLITQGHQDSSLAIALLRKFPGITQGEFEAGLDRLTADRIKARRKP